MLTDRVAYFRQLEREIKEAKVAIGDKELVRDSLREMMTPGELQEIETIPLPTYFYGPEDPTVIEKEPR